MVKKENRPPLKPGETSIEWAGSKDNKRLSNGSVRINWRICLYDGRELEKQSQGPSIGIARMRARAAAEKLLAANGASTWRITDDLPRYLTQVAGPAIEVERLGLNTRKRYRSVLKLLAGDCDEHQHHESLKGHTIGTGARFRVLEKCLLEIARLHGSETAHQARSVASKYLCQQLIRDELIQGNPLQGMSIDLSGYHKGKRPQKTSVAALGGDEWNKVLDHLLALDPAVGAVKPKAGRYDLAYRVRKREAAVNLMLLQATTGLRVDEASQVTWSLLQVDDDGQGHVVVTPDITKGKKKGRTIPILDDRVVQRLLKKRKAASDPKQGWVIASPFDETKRWNSKDRNTATRDLCLELAAKLELKLFEVERTHFWRATLNSLLDGSVPEAVRAAYFGHTTRVNRESYTDVYDVTEMKEAAKLLRKDPQPTAG